MMPQHEKKTKQYMSSRVCNLMVCLLVVILVQA